MRKTCKVQDGAIFTQSWPAICWVMMTIVIISWNGRYRAIWMDRGGRGLSADYANAEQWARHRYLSPAVLPTLTTKYSAPSAIKSPQPLGFDCQQCRLSDKMRILSGLTLIQSRQGTDTWFPDWLQLCTLSVSLWVAARLCGWPRPVQRVGMMLVARGMPEISNMAKV